MHSGYGGVSEMQQFMVDGGWPSSAPSGAASEIQKFHPLSHPQAPPPPPHLQQAPPTHFAPFGHPPIPITQQLFHHPPHPHHQFQLFQHHQQQSQMGLDHESGHENPNSPPRIGGPSFLAAMNFKLGVNESGGSGGRGSRDGLNDDDGILQGDDGSESRIHHSWHREEESAANIKEPFWRPLDIDYINPNNKRPAAKEKQPAAAAEISSSNAKRFKKSNECVVDNSNNNNTATTTNTPTATTADSNYKLFSELEAIYKPGGTPTSGGGGGAANNQTGSGSALTGDDNNPFVPANAPGPALDEHVSDTSNGAGQRATSPAAAQAAATNQSGGGAHSKAKQRSKRRQQKQQLASIASFFESLVKQLMDHQEELHRKFLEVMERRDQERTNREESWRKQEAARANREAAARAQERALAAAREAAIISFLEKITGESLNLPTKAQFQAQFVEESQKEQEVDHNAMEPHSADTANNASNAGAVQLISSSRWPKAEVEALIQVRSGFESRFQEPGLKGPLWEEVSAAMGSMGYQRSAKRCKEKWENINKYFRKTKDSGKKRPQHSKTCPYFHQLDQLYSKPQNPTGANNAAATGAGNHSNNLAAPSSSNANANSNGERKDNSELLDAIVVSNADRFNEANINDEENEEEEEEEEEEGEEGQGESEGQGRDHGGVNEEQQQQLDQISEEEQSRRHDTARFFQRLRS